MKKSITPKEIKSNNRQMVFHYLYQHPASSQQELTYELCLSRPTVSTYLAELKAAGMIEETGQISSEYVGRKAVAYSVVGNYRVAIGLHVHADRFRLVAVNLYGNLIKTSIYSLDYSNEPAYFEESCRIISEFVHSLELSDDQILGISIILPALVSDDGKLCTYGEIIGCTGITIDAYQQHLSWPCLFMHDAASAAASDLWCMPDLDEALFLRLSRHLGAAYITDHRVAFGKHGHAATMEHITLHPGGEKCYCGRRGCAETTLSVESLLKDFDDNLESFFEKARCNGTPQYTRWGHYLEDLAHLISITHLTCDTNYILGGELTPFISQEDIRLLYKLIQMRIPFKDTDDYLLISKMPNYNTVMGGALSMIRLYLDNIFE